MNCGEDTEDALEYFERKRIEKLRICKRTKEEQLIESNADDDKHTLENALEYFGLSPRLRELEKTIEEVRICKKTKEEHEQLLKQIDKEMQKLSLKYHPDRVRNREGTDEDVTKAQKMQAALNATRTVLNVLSATFLEDICTDHKYEFYKKLHMRSLGNESEIKNRISEVLFKISTISEIKQACIISEIRKFLTESNRCIKEYLGDNVSDFKKHRDLALFHLKCCVKGYEKLCLELEGIEKECKHEKLDNISCVIFKMTSECKREQTLLKELQKTAQRSLRMYKFYSPGEPMNPYFVEPLVSYVNVILMCNVMKKDVSWWERWISPAHSVLKRADLDLLYLMDAYYLASYYSGNHKKKEAIRIMCNRGFVNLKSSDTDQINGGIFYNKCQETFKKVLSDVSTVLENKFKIHNYVEFSSKKVLMEKLEQAMKVVAEFEETKKDLLKDIDELRKKSEEMGEKFEKYNMLFQESKELSRNLEETSEKNKKCMERVSPLLSNEP